MKHTFEKGFLRAGFVVWGVWWALVAFDSTSLAELQRFEFDQQQMGTSFRLIFYAGDQSAANSAAKAAFSRIAELNDVFSDYSAQSESRRLADTSQVFEKAGVAVSDDLWQVVVAADCISRNTGGAFDITVGPLTKLWRRARRRNSIPSTESIAKARAGVGHDRLELLAPSRSLRINGTEPIRLDFGGIAKGYAADAALKVLNQHDIRCVLIDAGGDLRLGDAPPDREGWKVAVASRRSAKPELTLLLHSCGVATSGDVWQFLEANGKRYSHVIDPRTGLGLTNRTAVTIVAGDAMTADGLASAVSVLGSAKGAAFIESMQRADPGMRAAARIVAFQDDGANPMSVTITTGFDSLGKAHD